MANGDLRQIYNAIETYYADDGVVEVCGIMNAFIRSIEAEEKLFVITETVEHNGEKHNVFTMIYDEEGHKVFPLFTDMNELIPLKRHLEIENRCNLGIMELGFVLNFLVERQLCDGIVVNPTSQNFNAPLHFYEDILNRELSSHITLIQADITELYTDAIVSSTDEFLSGTAGVDAAIQQAGGAKLTEKIQERLNISDVLGVKSTGDLHSRLVLFTRGPVYSEEMNYDDLYYCYYNCMNVAKQAECTSIAFPCICAGENGVPMNIVMSVSTKAVLDWLEANDDFKIDVYFCCYEDGDKENYQNYFDTHFGG